MKFPNTFKGIKKIWIAEMLMLLAAVLSIVLVFVIAGNSVVIDDAVVVNTEAVKTPTAIIGIGAAVIIFLMLTFFSLLSDAYAYFYSMYREVLLRLLD